MSVRHSRSWPRAALLLLVGLGAVGYLVSKIGAGTMLSTVASAAGWLPWLLALESGRIGTEAMATYFAYGERRATVPIVRLLRAQLIGTAIGSVAPAGRLAAEASKAVLLSRFVGRPAAAAGAAMGQAASLLASSVVSVPCTLASWKVNGISPLTLALVGNTLVLVLSGLGLRFGMQRVKRGSRLARALERIGARPEDFGPARVKTSVLLGPLCVLAAGRLLQVGQFALLAHAVLAPTSIGRALVAEGLNLTAAAVGTFVPAQLGVSDGAFAISSRALGTSIAQATSMALLAHVVQIFFVALGGLTVLCMHGILPSAFAPATAEGPSVPASPG